MGWQLLVYPCELPQCCVNTSSLPPPTVQWSDPPAKTRNMASSLSGHKRALPEQEVPPECSCAMCNEALLDPVTLPCGHTLDQRCLQSAVAAGQRLCPMCRAPLPTVLPPVNVLLRDMMQQRYPEQVPISRPNPSWAGAWWAGWSDLVVVWCCFVCSCRPSPSA